jgi:predicted O-methyltransferase YrrM
MKLTNLATRARSKAIRLLLPPPFQSQWASYCYVGSASMDRGRADAHLLGIAVDAIGGARNLSFSSLSERLSADAMAVLELWPGEHYRLIASLCAIVKPRRVIEIGTASGLSALAMLSALPTTSQIVSFDVLPWNYSGPLAWGGDTVLREADFRDGRLRQELGDLSNRAVFEKHRDLLAQTDLFFIDGPKDGNFERVFLKFLNEVSFASPPILIFDDIKLWNMLSIWQEVARPKLDMTSSGHWSGTGLIHWR